MLLYRGGEQQQPMSIMQHSDSARRKGSSQSLFPTLQIGGWIAFAAAVSVGRIGELTLAEVVVIDWALAAFGFVVTLGLGAIYSRLRIRGAPLVRVLGVALVSSFVGGSLWTAAYRLYLTFGAPVLLSTVSDEQLFPNRAESLYPLLADNVYSSLVLLAWSMLYIGGEYHRAMQAEREQRLRAEAQAHRAQLRALRYQLNPQFMSNALNAISTLVIEKRERDATGMIACLSEFLRLRTEGDGVPEVPLAEELQVVKRYLELEQVRFGDRLHTTAEVDVDTLSCLVPSLILQSLIENAIEHAVSQREEGGRIAVEARRNGTYLLLRVVDNGPGLGVGPHAEIGGGGLTNTRERLMGLYGKDHRVEWEEAPGGGLSVSIRIPLRSAPALVAAGAL